MFKKATKKDLHVKMALCGSSGSGKTYTALAIASELVNDASKIAVLDTEHGSASKYSDVFSFDVAELDTSYEIEKYIDAIKAAQDAGYQCLIIDSLSHAWFGSGGALDMADKITARSKSGNRFLSWRDVTPLQNKLVETILSAKMHIISTMRVKSEYVIEETDRGKKAPRKIGLAPIQRDGLEYEFDIIAELDQNLNFVVTKTRCSELVSYTTRKAGAEVAEILKAWCGTGKAPIADDKPKFEAASAKSEGGTAKLVEIMTREPEFDEDPKNDLFEKCRSLSSSIGKASTMAELESLIDDLKDLPEQQKTSMRVLYKAKARSLGDR